MSEERIKQIIEAFDRFDGTYKRAEMEEALTLKEEITPFLIRILEDLATDPKTYVDEDHYANVYAVALLAHFQEPAAHLPIIRAFCMCKEEREELWGDMVTETLPALLLLTSSGSLDAIKDLVLNREAYEFVRCAAIDALTYAVARGMADRSEIVPFLAGLLTGSEAEEDSYFWCSVVSALADLHPGEVMEPIRKAYEDGLVYDGYIGLDKIEKDALKDQTVVLNKLREDVDRRLHTDIHGYFSWFGCFTESEVKLPTAFANTTLKASVNKKEKNRAKRKIAKASKKKNRR
jgi:hypothetical protein